MRPERGLTLVELLVALALLALIGAIGVPYLLAALPGFRVSAATRQVLGDLRLARTLSVERGLDVLVSFHQPAADQYRLAFDTYPPPPGNDHALTPQDEAIKTVVLAERYRGIRLSSTDPAAPPDGVSFGANVAIFTSDGRSSSGAVYLQPGGDYGVRTDRDRKITVRGATGRAKAYVWEGTGWR